MAQFDVYKNLNPGGNRSILYLLDVQADLLAGLTTRVVVPLVAVSAMGKMGKHLNPQFKIKRCSVVMSTAELAGVNVNLMGEKVGSLKEQRDEIIAALDFLFTGF
jgi:toxin CcdB